MSSACSLSTPGSIPSGPTELCTSQWVKVIPNSVFLCCGYYFTPTSLLGSSEMSKTIGQALSNLRQKRLHVPQHFACSLSLASLPTVLWSHTLLAFLLLLMALAETFLAVLHFPCWLQLQLTLPMHVGMEFIMSYVFMFLPSGLLLLPPSVYFFFCV